VLKSPAIKTVELSPELEARKDARAFTIVLVRTCETLVWGGDKHRLCSIKLLHTTDGATKYQCQLLIQKTCNKLITNDDERQLWLTENGVSKRLNRAPFQP